MMEPLDHIEGDLAPSPTLFACVGDRIVTTRGAVVEVVETRDWPDAELREYVTRDAAGRERVEHGYAWISGRI